MTIRRQLPIVWPGCWQQHKSGGDPPAGGAWSGGAYRSPRGPKFWSAPMGIRRLPVPPAAMKVTRASMWSSREAACACIRRCIGVAPSGARSSSFPGYLQLSASSRCLFALLSAASLGRVPPTWRAPVFSSSGALSRGGASPCHLARPLVDVVPAAFAVGSRVDPPFFVAVTLCLLCAAPCRSGASGGGGAVPSSRALCECSLSSLFRLRRPEVAQRAAR